MPLVLGNMPRCGVLNAHFRTAPVHDMQPWWQLMRSDFGSCQADYSGGKLPAPDTRHGALPT